MVLMSRVPNLEMRQRAGSILLEGLDELGVLLNGPVATGLALWRLLVGHSDLGFVELLLENGLQTAHLVAELFVLGLERGPREIPQG